MISAYFLSSGSHVACRLGLTKRMRRTFCHLRRRRSSDARGQCLRKYSLESRWLLIFFKEQEVRKGSSESQATKFLANLYEMEVHAARMPLLLLTDCATPIYSCCVFEDAHSKGMCQRLPLLPCHTAACNPPDPATLRSFFAHP